MALERRVLKLFAPLLLVAPGGAAAVDPQLPTEELAPAQRVEILSDRGAPTSRGAWLAYELRRVDLSGRYGLVYKRAFDVGERGLEFRLRGPALGRKRQLGLSFEARF